MSDCEIEEKAGNVLEIFRKMDKNKNGTIDFNEFYEEYQRNWLIRGDAIEDIQNYTNITQI